MNIFAKRMTLGFVLALLVAMIIGYGGMKRKVLPLYAEEINQQSICAVFIQDLRAFLGDSPSTILAYDYYSGVEFPLPEAFGAIDGRPF
jgi:hypothetical protein